jgi:hypothetical protein
MEDLDNETDDQFEYRRKMKDLFKQKKWKESTEKCIEFILDSYSNNYIINYIIIMKIID